MICTLHCDVPAIAHKCDFETADLVINLTKRSFGSMESLALDTGAVSKWPAMCKDIKTYRLPKPGEFLDSPLPPEHEDDIIASGPIVKLETTTVVSTTVSKSARVNLFDFGFVLVLLISILH